jgi:hypothetical protein
MVVVRGCLAGAFIALVCSGSAFGQESKSAPLAKQLVAALDAAKLDSIAARDPADPNVFIGALYIPGLQLLTIAAHYSAPQLLDERLAKHEYRDMYIELNSAGTAGSKVFIEDLGGDGLKATREDTTFDSYEAMGKRTAFDGEWLKQELSEEEYLKIFAAADERYSQMLTALVAEAKKGP